MFLPSLLRGQRGGDVPCPPWGLWGYLPPSLACWCCVRTAFPGALLSFTPALISRGQCRTGSSSRTFLLAHPRGCRMAGHGRDHSLCSALALTGLHSQQKKSKSNNLSSVIGLFLRWQPKFHFNHSKCLKAISKSQWNLLGLLCYMLLEQAFSPLQRLFWLYGNSGCRKWLPGSEKKLWKESLCFWRFLKSCFWRVFYDAKPNRVCKNVSDFFF